MKDEWVKTVMKWKWRVEQWRGSGKGVCRKQVIFIKNFAIQFFFLVFFCVFLLKILGFFCLASFRSLRNSIRPQRYFATS